MPQIYKSERGRTLLLRAFIEIAFILFLFYANLLMGEYTRANRHTRTLALALRDIFTPENFLVAIVSALIGYLVFEALRKQL